MLEAKHGRTSSEMKKTWFKWWGPRIMILSHLNGHSRTHATSFGFIWACQSIAKLKSSIEKSPILVMSFTNRSWWNCTKEFPEVSRSANAYPPKDCFKFHMGLHFSSAECPEISKKLAQGLYYINIPLFWLPILKNLGAELITEILTTFLKTRESFKNKVMFFLHGAIHQHLSGQIQQNSNSPTRCDFVGFVSKYQLHMKSRHLLDYLTLRTPCKWGRIRSIPYPMICDNRIFESTHFTLSGWWMSGSIEQCWRFVINFGLQWSLCQAKTVNRKCLICKQRGAGNIKRMTKKECWCKSLGTCVLELRKISATNLNHQHLHSHPHNDHMPQDPQEVSCPILVRGHGPYCPAHPRPPWPPGAAQRPNRGLHGLPSAAVCSLGSGGPGPSRRQNPTKRRGEELCENLGTSKVKVLEIVATQNSLMRCLEDIELVFKNVAYSVLSKPCQPSLQSRCPWISSNILQL